MKNKVGIDNSETVHFFYYFNLTDVRSIKMYLVHEHQIGSGRTGHT